MGPLLEPIAASPADLPPKVAAALATPIDPVISTTAAAGYAFAAREWGDPAGRPLLLVHGVTSSSDTWWRVGPALAASRRRVVAPDLPGHGLTGGWGGRYRFRETAEDLVAFAGAAGLTVPELQVVGHSWGGMVSAALPSAGLMPERLVLLDPPAWPQSAFEGYVGQPTERRYASLDEAVAALRPLFPTWLHRDIVAKAEALTQFDEDTALAIVLENGDWDAGLGALEDSAARGVPIWYVLGDEGGSMIPAAWLPRLAARVSAEHVLTIKDGEHSPQRQRPEATVLALLRALGD